MKLGLVKFTVHNKDCAVLQGLSLEISKMIHYSTSLNCQKSKNNSRSFTIKLIGWLNRKIIRTMWGSYFFC